MKQLYDVIIIGGSYAGLATATALGRALQQVLIIDSDKPCNAPTPHSHNFLTQDGNTPADIAAIAKQQVAKYPTIQFFAGTVIKAGQTAHGFTIEAASGEQFQAAKLVFATGIRDMLPDVAGLSDCWAKCVLHCPFCHGYEIKGEKTGIIGNGTAAYEMVRLIANWTKDLTLFTNGPADLTAEQKEKLRSHQITLNEKKIERLAHDNGYMQHISFKDGAKVPLKAAYIRSPFRQACPLPETLGCALTEDGYIQVDAFQATSIAGVYACGDSTNKLRTVATAVASGTTAGMTLSKQLITQAF